MNKEDDPCGSGLRLEQLDHASGSNMTVCVCVFACVNVCVCLHV